MATHYVPSIAAVKYPAFQQVCCDRLPKTYAEWRQIKEREHRDIIASGHKIIPVAIEPGELKRYCQETGCQANSTALDNLAFEIGARG
jgi:hypothetical protein